MKKQALGKGLGALIAAPKEKEIVETGITHIPVDSIRPNQYQPRREFSESAIEELANSIKEKGVLTPILVRRAVRGYELIAGERRLRAVTKLGLNTIPALVKEVTEEEALELALIENIQREDLNPIEEAQAYQILIERFGLKHDELAQRVGKDRSTITNLLRLLELPDTVQDDVSRGTLTMGHARTLLGLATPQQMAEVANLIKEKQYSVRQTEALVNRLKAGLGRRKTKPSADIHVQELEEKIRKVLGTKVNVITRGNGGKIIIEFNTLDELDRLLSIFGAN
jgi:ParB family transcriptional regulator, chromosome partitioning protein